MFTLPLSRLRARPERTVIPPAVLAQSDAPQTKRLLRQTFGPWPHCRALVWEQLVDIASWVQWMPDVKAVNRLDSGPLGRGTRIQVDKALHSEIWEVTHWHDQRRIDIEIDGPSCRVGFCVQLAKGADEDHAILRLDCESETNTLLAWLSERRIEQSGLSWLRGFTRYFLAQRPLAD